MSTTTSAVVAAQDIDAPEARASAKPRANKKLLLAAAAGLVAVAGGGWYFTHLGIETTDDAQVDADVVSVPARVSGVVTKIVFTEDQPVKAGDLLAELDPEPAKAKLAQAEATLAAAKASAQAAAADAKLAEANARGNKHAAEAQVRGATSSAGAASEQIGEAKAQVAAAQANLLKAESDLQRMHTLVGSGVYSPAALDQVQAARDAAAAAVQQAKARVATTADTASQAGSRVQEANAKLEQVSDVDAFVEQARAKAQTAEAQVSTAQAARDLAALELSYTRIVAPQDGVASSKSIAVGQMVSPGQGIVQLVPAETPWITANFKETQIKHMHPGQPARLTIDAYPGVKLQGEVVSFSGATGSRFTLLPPDNASGNFTKVVQRVPVRVQLKDLPPGVVLRPGMSVDLSVDTNG